MNQKKGISILGSTGSVGCNVLRVVEAFPERFRVVGLAAGDNVERLAEQIARHRPRVVSVSRTGLAERLRSLVDLSGIDVTCGEAGMVAVATAEGARMVVAAAVGAVGLVPTYRALDSGRDVALANKETLVMAGELMVRRAGERGARLLPIDSEHCALHQCLEGRPRDHVERLVLTASGGPLRERSGSFADVSREEALAHPTWSMGRKITIDSATLMNKGLEVIEARWLFGLAAERIEVLVHPQSLVHSLVEFVDGTLLAQLGVNDMRMPIQYALSWPERWPAAAPRLDLATLGRLDFEAPDHGRFPCLGLAYRALEGGGSLPAALNAANEVAVQAFLDGRVPFTAIAEIVEAVVSSHRAGSLAGLEDVLEADREARAAAGAALRKHARTTLAAPGAGASGP
jgi:1-deoxy-D-xylulose-5-phosphate reductoisomerase